MGGNHPEPVLEDEASLQAFFADLGLQSRTAIYRDMRFETEYRLPPNPRPGLITMEPETRGMYVKLYLGVRVDANADLRSRWGVEPGHDDLDSWFEVYSTDEQKLRQYLDGEPEKALIRLARGYSVVLHDDSVQFGPLLTSPAESAHALASLVDALPRPAFAAVPFRADPCARGRGSKPDLVIGYATTSRRAHELRDAIVARGIPCDVDTLRDMAPQGPDAPPPRFHLLVPEACENKAVKLLRDLSALK